MARKQNSKPEGTPSADEMLECLQRSGYMLESTVVRNLHAAGFFVEPNQSLQDERTGKSRELDIVAEFYSYNPDHRGVCVKTTFVIEVINNSYPFVLTTQRPWTPNSPLDDYVRYASTPSEDHGNPFLGHVDVFNIKGFENWQLHSQYCAFTRKKSDSELMAHHPDDVHSSIQKMVEYSIDAIQTWPFSEPDKYWRLFFWQPVLVLRGDLFILNDTPDTKPELKPAKSGKLEYNFHYRGKAESMLVDIVTEPHLLRLLKDYVMQDETCEEQIVKLRSNGILENTEPGA